eukprot:m.203939 g.203939  ORF g.203939 m.203939 type:complete len:92 (+) comp15378_c0_seq3:654-929(+)
MPPETMEPLRFSLHLNKETWIVFACSSMRAPISILQKRQVEVISQRKLSSRSRSSESACAGWSNAAVHRMRKRPFGGRTDSHEGWGGVDAA